MKNYIRLVAGCFIMTIGQVLVKIMLSSIKLSKNMKFKLLTKFCKAL